MSGVSNSMAKALAGCYRELLQYAPTRHFNGLAILSRIKIPAGWPVQGPMLDESDEVIPVSNIFHDIKKLCHA